MSKSVKDGLLQYKLRVGCAPRKVQGVQFARWLGFVDMDFVCSTVWLTAWAEGNLAEAAGQLVKIVEHNNQSQPNPGLQGHGTPCTSGSFSFKISSPAILSNFLRIADFIIRQLYPSSLNMPLCKSHVGENCVLLFKQVVVSQGNVK